MLYCLRLSLKPQNTTVAAVRRISWYQVIRSVMNPLIVGWVHCVLDDCCHHYEARSLDSLHWGSRTINPCFGKLLITFVHKNRQTRLGMDLHSTPTVLRQVKKKKILRNWINAEEIWVLKGWRGLQSLMWRALSLVSSRQRANGLIEEKYGCFNAQSRVSKVDHLAWPPGRCLQQSNTLIIHNNRPLTSEVNKTDGLILKQSDAAGSLWEYYAAIYYQHAEICTKLDTKSKKKKCPSLFISGHIITTVTVKRDDYSLLPQPVMLC